MCFFVYIYIYICMYDPVVPSPPTIPPYGMVPPRSGKGGIMDPPISHRPIGFGLLHYTTFLTEHDHWGGGRVGAQGRLEHTHIHTHAMCPLLGGLACWDSNPLALVGKQSSTPPEPRAPSLAVRVEVIWAHGISAGATTLAYHGSGGRGGGECGFVFPKP